MKFKYGDKVRIKSGFYEGLYGDAISFEGTSMGDFEGNKWYEDIQIYVYVTKADKIILFFECELEKVEE